MLRLSGRSPVFVKLYDTCVASKDAALRRRLARERTCLEVLSSFAVPQLVDVPKGALIDELGFEPCVHLAQEFIPGQRFGKGGLTPSEQLGAWLFLTENLVAFRRHQILYTDIKPSNVIVRSDPLQVVQIDFDLATVANEEGIYPADSFGYTPGYEAPEHGKGPTLRESALVFQLGMLLGKGLIGLQNSHHALCEGAEGLSQKVARLSTPSLGRLAAACVAPEAEDRPRDYEETLAQIKRCVSEASKNERRRKAFAVWRALRAPFAESLAEVGLTP
ncbi:MAG: hypothetical protein JKY65_19310 [Planctomycetes bacterium]|nr:hypothetical protein [Planctomycetota bacterium]